MNSSSSSVLFVAAFVDEDGACADDVFLLEEEELEVSVMTWIGLDFFGFVADIVDEEEVGTLRFLLEALESSDVFGESGLEELCFALLTVLLTFFVASGAEDEEEDEAKISSISDTAAVAPPDIAPPTFLDASDLDFLPILVELALGMESRRVCMPVWMMDVDQHQLFLIRPSTREKVLLKFGVSEFGLVRIDHFGRLDS